MSCDVYYRIFQKRGWKSLNSLLWNFRYFDIALKHFWFLMREKSVCINNHLCKNRYKVSFYWCTRMVFINSSGQCIYQWYYSGILILESRIQLCYSYVSDPYLNFLSLNINSSFFTFKKGMVINPDKYSFIFSLCQNTELNVYWESFLVLHL